MFGFRRKSALLIDFENVYFKCGKERFVERIDNWLRWLEDGKFDPEGGKRKFVSKHVFWVPSYEKYRLEFVQRKFQVQVCRAIRKEKASSADFDLTIRAAELRHEYRDLKEIVILSFDADFTSVLGHIQLHDLYGVGMVDPETNFAKTYRNVVDVTIEKADFQAAYDYAGARRSAVPPPPEPAPPSNADSKASVAQKKPGARKFDPAAAAEIICRYAAENELVLLGRERVRKLLQRQPGFVVNGKPWADGSYRAAIDSIVTFDPRLSVEKVENGGFVLSYKPG